MRGTRRGGRPMGEVSYSGRKLMTAYTRPSGGSRMTMKVAGRAARTNGVQNLAGRSTSKSYTGDPNRRRIKN